MQSEESGVSRLGFIMEENDNDTVTIFVPTPPTPTLGRLYIVERSRVTLLDASHVDVIKCITDWGIGSDKFIGKKGS